MIDLVAFMLSNSGRYLHIPGDTEGKSACGLTGLMLVKRAAGDVVDHGHQEWNWLCSNCAYTFKGRKYWRPVQSGWKWVRP